MYTLRGGVRANLQVLQRQEFCIRQLRPHLTKVIEGEERGGGGVWGGGETY